MTSIDKMTTTELQSCLALSSIFFFRMFGLFLILPVFVLYAETLRHATPTLIGIALGSYGLTQAIFQVPFGMLSDRIGRKQVITGGLLVFICGSILAGYADSIYLVILGRALQGAGAIAAAIMALAADLTRDSQRSKAMALIGVSIGLAFALAFVIGPVLEPFIGVPGLFFTSAGLAFVAIIILLSAVPNPDLEQEHVPARSGFAIDFTNVRLLMLFISIFLLHTLLMSSFVVIPLTLRDLAGLDSNHHWQVYLPVLLISAILMLPFLYLGDKYGKVNLFLCGAIVLMFCAQAGFYFLHQSVLQIAMLLTLFFLSFNYLEATLPALVSKMAPPEKKGAALGVFSTSQFIGTFVGGLTGGFIYDHFNIKGVFVAGTIISIIWFIGMVITQTQVSYNG